MSKNKNGTDVGTSYRKKGVSKKGQMKARVLNENVYLTAAGKEAFLKAIRLLGGATKASEKLEYSRMAINRVENGTHRITSKLAERIEEATNGAITKEMLMYSPLESEDKLFNFLHPMTVDAMVLLEEDNLKDLLHNMINALTYLLSKNKFRNEKDSKYIAYIFGVDPAVFKNKNLW